MLFDEFKNKQVTDTMFNQVDSQGMVSDPEVKWLSRGLIEACIGYIDDTKKGDGLRVCAYEFTYRRRVRRTHLATATRAAHFLARCSRCKARVP